MDDRTTLTITEKWDRVLAAGGPTGFFERYAMLGDMARLEAENRAMLQALKEIRADALNFIPELPRTGLSIIAETAGKALIALPERLRG